MKRNRSKYLIYLEPWTPGRHVVAHSKGQMKKILAKANPGSEAIKNRLIHYRDGSISFWNMDREYLPWVKT